MSDADRPPREWRFYIADMIEFGENVLSFTDGMDRDTFIGDARTYHAVLRNLELIGEAATHVPLLVRQPGGAAGASVDDLVELRDVTATMLWLAGVDRPDYMDARPLPGLGLADGPPRERIFGMLARGWMAFDGRWKLAKYAPGRALLFDLENDPDELRDLASDPAHAETLRRLDDELTGELMDSIEFAMHDRLTAPYSLAQDEAFAREGWTWRFPSPASAAAETRGRY